MGGSGYGELTVSVTRTVDVGVVTSIGLVFYMGRIDGDATRLFLGGLVNL